MRRILWLGDDGCADAALVGGKAANLSRLAARHLVPPGFCLTTEAYAAATAGLDGTAHGQAPPLPPDLRAELEAAYQELARRCGVDDPPVAVRSSAADEDGGSASFAGQHETYLNVRGPSAVCDAVVRCWRSLWLPRALAYRRERGLPVAGARLAVLVQQLVPAEVSGVLFSANPVTGALDQAVLNVSWGLGESVVGGHVSPDTYAVQRRPLASRQRQVGRKRRMTVLAPGGTAEVDVPDGWRTLPALDDALVLDAVLLGADLEEEMGWPVDVELAWHCSALYVLQCRPITALSPAAPAPLTEAPARERMVDLLGEPDTPPAVRWVTGDAVPPGTWSRHWHYPVPVTPLYADFEFGAHLALANVAGREEHHKTAALFPARRDRRTSFLVVDGYAYSMSNRVEVANPGPQGSDEVPAAGAPRGGGYEYAVWQRWQDTVRPRMVADLRRYRQTDLAALTDGELLARVRQLSWFLVEGWAQLHCPGPAFNLIRRRCARFCERHLGLDQTRFLELFNGCSEATSAPVRAMEAVADRLLHDPSLLAALDQSEPWQDGRLRAALAEYVETFGHKATDWEYVTPTLAERPARVIALLREAVARLRRGAGGAADEVHRRRRALEDALRARLPDDETRRTFGALLRDAQAVFGMQEEHVTLYNQGEGAMRYALLAAGARLVARDRLSAADRVFFLRRPELEALLEGGHVEGLPELADARWRAYERQKAHKGPQTLVGWAGPAHGASAPAPRARPASGAAAEVRGIGASSGVYEGPARVVLTEDQFEEVCAGDVLVSPQTSPSWTILFGRIGALVTDDGGILSHSAIASREFGIPAVLSTGIATSAVTTGQRVRVDGTAGVVVVLP